MFISLNLVANTEMKRLILLSILSSSFLTSCTNPDVGYQTLYDAGYKDPVHLGYNWYGCGKDDTFADKFEVTAPSGKRIQVVVCSGLMKGATIRHL